MNERTNLIVKPLETTVYNIIDFGAVPDGETICDAAIQKAIDACGEAGGGTVYCPPGVFHTCSLVLRSHITLYLSTGCTLLAQIDRDNRGYKFQGSPFLKCFIYAMNLEDVLITGSGTIHGQGDAYWHKLNKKLTEERPYHNYAERAGWADVAQHWYQPDFDRYGQMIALYDCKNCRIGNINMTMAPGFNILMHGCTNMTVTGVNIHGPYHGPNTDGIDINSCSRVLVSNCNVHTGDDCICMKSMGINGNIKVCKDIAITNCILSTACNGIKMGTESIGGFQNISISNCVITCEDDAQQNRAIGGVCIETTDGGHNENINVLNITMRNVRAPLFVYLGARVRQFPPMTEEEMKAFKPGGVKNINFTNITAMGASITSSITGAPGYPIENLNLDNVTISYRGGEDETLARAEVPERPRMYPETSVYGKGAAGGLYCRHAKNISIAQMKVCAEAPDGRPGFIFDDVHGLDLIGVRVGQRSGDMPAILTRGCTDVNLYASPAETTVEEDN